MSDPRLPAPATAVTTARPSRPVALTAGLLVASAVAGAGLLELRQEQRERAAAGALDLRLEASGSAYESPGEPAGQGRVLRADVQVRNAGRRPVELLGAELTGPEPAGGALTSRAAGRVVAPGEAWSAALAGPVRCDVGPPRLAPPGSVLRVRAVTGAGARTADVAVPADLLAGLQATAERTCASPPTGPAVRVQRSRGRVVGGRLLLDVRLAVDSGAPVDLVRVVPALPGIRVAVRTGNRPPVFPFRLEPAPDGARTASALGLVVSVADCAVLRRAIGGAVEVLESALLVDLAVAVAGRPGEGVTSVVDTGGLPRLLSGAC